MKTNTLNKELQKLQYPEETNMHFVYKGADWAQCQTPLFDIIELERGVCNRFQEKSGNPLNGFLETDCKLEILFMSTMLLMLCYY